MIRRFPDWDVTSYPTLADTYDALPPQMEHQPFGRTIDGRSVDFSNGSTMAPFVNLTLDTYAKLKLTNTSSSSSASELSSPAWHAARAEAMETLLRKINGAIRDPEFHLTEAQLLDRRTRYSIECDVYLSKFCWELAGRNPEFELMSGDSADLRSEMAVARSFSLRQVYLAVPALVRWIHSEEMYCEATGPNQVVVRWSCANARSTVSEVVGDAYARMTCDFITANQCAIPREHSGLPPARFVDLACQSRGDEYCEWQFTWEHAPRPNRWWTLVGLVAALVMSAVLVVGTDRSVLNSLWLSLPLLLAGAVVGLVLGQARDREMSRRRFDDQRNALEAEAELSARSESNLHQANSEMRARLRQITAVTEISETLSAVTHIDERIAKTVQALVDRLGFDRASVLLVDDSDETLWLHSQNTDDTTLDAPLSLADDDDGRAIALRSNSAVVIDWPTASGELVQALGAPMISSGRRLGVLAVDNRESRRVFKPEEHSLMGTVANQLGSALEGFRLYSDMELQVASRTTELTIARQQAEDASRTKSTFLANVSHELRTPLTSILGFVRLVDKRLEDRVFPHVDTSEERVQIAVRRIQENLGIVRVEGERLTKLINDVLDLEKIEAGKMAWEFDMSSVESIIRQAVASVASIGEQRNVALTVQIADGLPDLMVDHDRVVQVLINLLSNAYKFTDEGTVSVMAELVNGDASDASFVQVSVTDEGSGIATEDHQAVFEAFRQVGDTLTDKPQGTGLGLPISKEIITHHQGDLWLESSLGKGSTFAFTLPVPSTERS